MTKQAIFYTSSGRQFQAVVIDDKISLDIWPQDLVGNLKWQEEDSWYEQDVVLQGNDPDHLKIIQKSVVRKIPPRRNEVRHDANLDAVVIDGSKSHPVRIIQLSAGGVILQTKNHLPRARTMLLKTPQTDALIQIVGLRGPSTGWTIPYGAQFLHEQDLAQWIVDK